MKKLAVAFILLLCAPAVRPAGPAPLTTLHAVAALGNKDASRQPAVAFPATVIYFNGKTENLFVQENEEAIYVRATTSANLVPGDRVLVKGTLQPSFLPYVLSDNITRLGHGAVPTPLPATYDDLIHKRINSRFVTVRGVVQSADLVSDPTSPGGHMQLLMDGGSIEIEISHYQPNALQGLLDAEVEVTGAAGRKLDGKVQQIGAMLQVTSLADIKVLSRAQADPWSLPVTPLDDIATGIHVRDLSRRLRVHGTITYYQPGSAVVLQNGAGSLWISTQTSVPLRIGDLADATGFPDNHDNRLNLAHSEIKDSGTWAPAIPVAANWRELAFWGRSKLGGHAYDLVTTEGRVVTEAREATQDVYVLVTDNREFTAIYRHPRPPASTPKMLEIPVGASIRVTGICVPQSSDAVNEEAPFNILLRSFDDVQIVAGASLLTVRNMSIVCFIFFFCMLIFGLRSWLDRDRSHSESKELADLERRRRCILEEISGSSPLPDIIEHVADLVSFRLRGAPCWCEVTDFGRYGNCPEDTSKMRVIPIEIPARTGPPLGTIFAAFPAKTRSSPEQLEAVSMGAGLAALAVGTKRLYNDLLHRSEFDLLTDIQNRFSLEKHLDTLIEEARHGAGLFGLVFIDLDGFKQINDHYGHHVGDVYLQEAASRMKRQLRPADTIARLGGDEFAVLVPVAHSRSEVLEIADRLDRCFRRPFTVQRHVLKGAASIGIAMYPEDADNREDLLRIADHAMYDAKNARKAQMRAMQGADQPPREFASR